MKKALRAAAALVLCCLLAVPARAADWRAVDHRPVDYFEMSTGFDPAPLEAALDRLEALGPALEGAGLRAELEDLCETVVRETDELATRSALAELRHDADGRDQAAADRAADLALLYTELSDRAMAALAPLAEGPCRDILAAGAGEEGLEALAAYAPLTDRQADLLEEEDRLVRDYDALLARPVEVAAEGRVWTEETLEADRTLDDEAWYAVRDALDRERHRRAGDLFLRLVDVRTELARSWGCDSYTDYAYQALYGRDFTAEDIASLRRAVKEAWVPLEARMWDALSQGDLDALDRRASGASGEEILDAVEPLVSSLDPELGETFAFMRQYHLCDIGPGQAKLPVGYTVGLPAYGSAFLFNDPYGDYQDYSTLIHEFGHFTEAFHNPTHALWDTFYIDVGEIHSQGLEVLSTAWGEDLFGAAGGRGYRGAVLLNMVTCVLEGFLYDEFQAEAYAHPDMGLEELDRLFRELSEEYGYQYGEGEAVSGLWTEVPHNFQSPLYYISYATSALSALELWLLAREDWDRAVETWLDLCAMGMSRPYREAVDAAGLGDIFRGRTVEDLARDLEAALLEEGARGRPDRALPGVLIGGGTAAAGLTAVTAVLVRRRRRRAGAALAAEEAARESG